ncbi:MULTISPECIES: dihydrofolate reductase family protein [Flavobacteriaceae]|uniref:dihydrofolate reductase family protein n=1 Tax=Flavobacteriaceae TaxID=49546 RepID=UPI001490AB7B|nr:MULTISPECIES: dihydrofolate reductase family protein [Allomuricauda]MDC6365526.1 dihydrofolate reductase family protein [Muricauda sp. AC10]
MTIQKNGIQTRDIIYYVASSLDGYISGKNDDISQFILQGEGVAKYQSDIAELDTVIMGRKTYEFGYQYGLEPGQPAYPNMEHHIFSDSLKVDTLSERVHIEKMNIQRVKEIKNNSKSDIYLCGGGQFAGWLLENGLIDQLKLKLNPIILGEGTKLFGSSTAKAHWNLMKKESFDDGLQILTYDIK